MAHIGLQLGGLMQTASAFGRVQDALSWFVSAYASLATWKATVDRLTSFHEALQQAVAQGAASPHTGIAPQAHGRVRYRPPHLNEHGDLIRSHGWSAFRYVPILTGDPA
jgi:hypothetical protein